MLALPAIYASEAGLNPLPVVFYHGMGDSCCNPQSIGKLSDAIKAEIEGVYVTSIKIGDTENQERRKGYMDNLDRQIDEVCRTLKSDERLRGGFHGVGISQGGQFLRAYVERCNDPPVKTYGLFFNVFIPSATLFFRFTQSRHHWGATHGRF